VSFFFFLGGGGVVVGISVLSTISLVVACTSRGERCIIQRR
jgi:hypothetical protein